MQLTKQGDYAIRTVLELSHHSSDTLLATKQIAAAQSIPEVYLTKIVQMLVRAGILETIRGAKGGVRLLKDPDHLSFREVIEAVEGPIYLNRCVEKKNRCDQSANCKSHDVWVNINNKLIQELENVKFADLVTKL